MDAVNSTPTGSKVTAQGNALGMPNALGRRNAGCDKGHGHAHVSATQGVALGCSI